MTEVMNRLDEWGVLKIVSDGRRQYNYYIGSYSAWGYFMLSSSYPLPPTNASSGSLSPFRSILFYHHRQSPSPSRTRYDTIINNTNVGDLGSRQLPVLFSRLIARCLRTHGHLTRTAAASNFRRQLTERTDERSE
ncbi:hypothetical protein TWF694_011156 [Orbilia ellipsospora]|uniref:Uncharacterized protein n=1 Tax=Orbilia ellipsospora TaxID=2528407 RepID=A0AAV9X878_9PEZI